MTDQDIPETVVEFYWRVLRGVAARRPSDAGDQHLG
jgi:hypothetical protein